MCFIVGLNIDGGPLDLTLREDRITTRAVSAVSTPRVNIAHAVMQSDVYVLINEWLLDCGLSRPTAGFRDRLLARDGCCVISGTRVKSNSHTRSYQAAHIYSRFGLSQWDQNNYGRWLNNENPDDRLGIDSIQNGMMLQAHIRTMWDDYGISGNVNVSFLS